MLTTIDLQNLRNALREVHGVVEQLSDGLTSVKFSLELIRDGVEAHVGPELDERTSPSNPIPENDDGVPEGYPSSTPSLLWPGLRAVQENLPNPHHGAGMNEFIQWARTRLETLRSLPVTAQRDEEIQQLARKLAELDA